MFTVSLKRENGGFALLETHRRLYLLAECVAWVFHGVELYYSKQTREPTAELSRISDVDHLKSMNQAIIYRVFWETVSKIAGETLADPAADEEDRLETMIRMLKYLNYWRRELDYLEMSPAHCQGCTFCRNKT